MKYQLVFDLQRFDNGDDAIEIPEELEGVSREVALEVMREEGMISPKNAEPKDETNDDDNTGEQDEDNQDGQAADADSVTKQTADKADPKPVPYKRFSEINAAKTKAEADLAAAMAKLAAYEQQQNPAASAEPTPQANQALQQDQSATQQQPTDYETLLYNASLEAFEKQYGHAYDEEFAPAADTAKLNRLIDKLDREAEATAKATAEQSRQAEEKQAVVNTAWQNMLTELSANNADYDNIIKFALTDKFNASDDLTKQALIAADARVSAGRPAAEDVILLRRYYTEAAEEFHSQTGGEEQQTAPTIPVQPKKPLGQQKLEKMAAHPRAASIKGSGDVGGVSIADATRMVNEEPWETLPKAIQDWALGK